MILPFLQTIISHGITSPLNASIKKKKKGKGREREIKGSARRLIWRLLTEVMKTPCKTEWQIFIFLLCRSGGAKVEKTSKKERHRGSAFIFPENFNNRQHENASSWFVPFEFQALCCLRNLNTLGNLQRVAFCHYWVQSTLFKWFEHSICTAPCAVAQSYLMSFAAYLITSAQLIQNTACRTKYHAPSELSQDDWKGGVHCQEISGVHAEDLVSSWRGFFEATKSTDMIIPKIIFIIWLLIISQALLHDNSQGYIIWLPIISQALLRGATLGSNIFFQFMFFSYWRHLQWIHPLSNLPATVLSNVLLITL